MTTQATGAAYLEDRAVLRISGPEARAFLQGLISNDMGKVTQEQTIYAALLTPQGKFLFDFFISQWNDSFLLDTRFETRQALIKRLTLYKLRANVVIEDVSTDYQIVALIGAAAEALKPTTKTSRGTAWAFAGGLAYVDPRLTDMGLRAILERPTMEKTIKTWGAHIVAMDSYTQHRLSLGMPEGGVDIVPEKAFLLESNFDEMGGVDHQKGCYIGQETTSRTKRRGSVRRRILPLIFSGQTAEPGTMITAGDVEIGSVLSGLGNRGLASIRLDRWGKAKETNEPIKANDEEVSIEMPDWIVLE